MQTRVVALDLGAADSADRLDAATADLDVATVVLNAGFGTSGPFLDGDTAAELSMIDVNCGAVLASSRLFGRRLAARGGGDLVLLSSVLAFQGAPLAAAYGATKAFVQSLAEALDVELAPRGVRVLSAAVGPTRSGFADVARMDLDVAMDADTVGRAIVRQVGGRGTIRPGWLSIALTLLTAPLPRWIATRIFGRAMATMTG
jgi:short-subunit dehydrogenase